MLRRRMDLLPLLAVIAAYRLRGMSISWHREIGAAITALALMASLETSWSGFALFFTCAMLFFVPNVKRGFSAQDGTALEFKERSWTTAWIDPVVNRLLRPSKNGYLTPERNRARGCLWMMLRGVYAWPLLTSVGIIGGKPWPMIAGSAVLFSIAYGMAYYRATDLQELVTKHRAESTALAEWLTGTALALAIY